MRSSQRLSTSARSARNVIIGGFCIVLAMSCARAQTDPSGSAWFPSGTLFMPLVANHEEPRMGLSQEIGNTRMKVAIGNALDVYEYRTGTDTLRASALFFAYALANDHRGYRLKIDAADGFFGIGFSYMDCIAVECTVPDPSPERPPGGWTLQRRRRDNGGTASSRSRSPGTTERSLRAYQWNISGYTLRPYAGIAYAPIVKPVAIRKWSVLAGWEAHGPGTTHLYARAPFHAHGHTDGDREQHRRGGGQIRQHGMAADCGCSCPIRTAGTISESTTTCAGRPWREGLRFDFGNEERKDVLPFSFILDAASTPPAPSLPSVSRRAPGSACC